MGASVPEEWGTLCSAEFPVPTILGRLIPPATAVASAPAPFMNVRRVNFPFAMIHLSSGFNLYVFGLTIIDLRSYPCSSASHSVFCLQVFAETKICVYPYYCFAGSLNFEKLESDVRVLGIDKRLMLIEPTSEGHFESKVVGREGEIAKLLGVDTRIVNERVRTLERRKKVGRTGVFLKHTLGPDEGFGAALHRLSRSRPAVRKRLD